MNSRQLDDLLALLDAKSLTEAAHARHVTQPAFSRRVRAIEQALGFEIIDRTKKPGRLTPSLAARGEDIRNAALTLNRLISDIKSVSGRDQLLRVSAMHSVSVSALPRAIKKLEQILPSTTVRLRSGNLKECYAMMVTGEVEILVSYETGQRRLRIDEELVERLVLKKDRLAPVISSDEVETLRSGMARGEDFPVVIYPPDSFIGDTLADILLDHGAGFSTRAISSLSPAILQMALCGIGVGWIPETLAEPYLETGQLTLLSDELPSAEMQMVMMRQRSSRSPFLEAGWDALKLTLV